MKIENNSYLFFNKLRSKFDFISSIFEARLYYSRFVKIFGIFIFIFRHSKLLQFCFDSSNNSYQPFATIILKWYLGILVSIKYN